MKQMLLGTALGDWALAWRARWELQRTAWRTPEAVGMMANDHLATELVVRLCDPERTFIDVGAHIGSVLAQVHREVPTARIVAVEAMPDKADALRQRFAYAKVHSCAVSDHSGTVSFYVDLVQSGYSSLRPASGTQTREIQVPLRRLDELVAPQDAAVVKIDVEGAELDVLRGAEALLAASRPVVMFESGPPEPGDEAGLDRLAQMHAFWTERDCELLVPNRVAHLGEGLTRTGFIESHLYPRRTTNYFALPRERRAALRERARAVLKLD